MNYVLLIISLMCGVGKNIVSKAGKNQFAQAVDMINVNMITAFVALVVFGSSGVKIGECVTALFIILATLYGIFTMLSVILYIMAVKDGDVSVCALIYACGFIIPTLFSALCFNEAIYRTSVFGLILLIISIVLVVGKKGSQGSRRYIIAAFSAMLCSGSVGVLQKLFNRIYGGANLNEFLFFAFGFVLLAGLCTKYILKSKGKAEKNIKYFIFSFILAGVTVGANKLNLYLSGVFDGIVFFPVINGGCIALSALMSRVIFKEKISNKQIIGIILSIVSIMLIFM